MTAHLAIGDLPLAVVFKDIKNVHLSVHPPDGRVTISAPERMNLETIRAFAITKLTWIRQQQRKLQAQVRETPREYLPGESHFVWGKRYLLQVVPAKRGVSVVLGHTKLALHLPQGASIERSKALLAQWYRNQIKGVLPKMLDMWLPAIGVEPAHIGVQSMKTKWGSCNRKARAIRLNTDLAKKPKECLEYVLVHELVHLLEPTHNARFTGIMDSTMPNWRLRRDVLNGLPLSHRSWKV